MEEKGRRLFVLADGSERPVYLLTDTGVLHIESPFASDAFKKDYNFFVEDFQHTPRVLEWLRERYHMIQANLYRKQMGIAGRILNKFLPYVPPIHAYGNFLDVGCNTASLLSKLPADWNKFGVEISRGAYKVAAGHRNVVVYNCSLEKFSSELKFKFIRASHVIEHVTDCEGFLSNIHHLLDSDGYALLYTPNTKSISRYLFGKYWYPFFDTTHVNLYNIDNLSALCRDKGFEVVEAGTYYMGITAGSIGLLLGLDPQSLPAKAIFYVFFCLLLPFSLIFNALNLGGALYLYIKKR